MNDQSRSKSVKQSSKYCDSNKKQKVDDVADASSILENYELELVNNKECMVTASGSNNQSNNSSSHPAEVFIKMESEDTLQDIEAEQNVDPQDFMFIDMSQNLELHDSNIKPDIGLQILELLKENSRRLTRIEERQNQLIKYITNKKLADVSELSLETMYDLQIPMTSLEKFDDFEKQLGDNELLHTDVCARLATCIDRKDCSLSKSFTNMFRTFMSKDLVVKFTASRRSTKSDKRQFNLTLLHKLMTGVLIKSRKERNLSYDMKDLMTALSEVISHAPQWNM